MHPIHQSVRQLAACAAAPKCEDDIILRAFAMACMQSVAVSEDFEANDADLQGALDELASSRRIMHGEPALTGGPIFKGGPGGPLDLAIHGIDTSTGQPKTISASVPIGCTCGPARPERVLGDEPHLAGCPVADFEATGAPKAGTLRALRDVLMGGAWRRPWTRHRSAGGREGITAAEFAKADEADIAILRAMSPERAKADAALIVAAVNMYEPMLKVCEAARAYYSDDPDGTSGRLLDALDDLEDAWETNRGFHLQSVR
jgi:hypothetical protein